jgi:hypothetical protein
MDSWTLGDFGRLGCLGCLGCLGGLARHGHGDIKRKTDAQAIFLILFVDEEIN